MRERRSGPSPHPLDQHAFRRPLAGLLVIGLHRQFERGCPWQLIGDMFDEAIAGHHAEADAADHSDVPLLCRLVTGEEVLQDGNFTRNIQVMGSGSQASLDERGSSGKEWSGGVEHCIYARYCPLKLIWLIKADGHPGETEAFSQRGE